jgi:exodeoxyribonuclease VII small subunit
MSEPVAEPTFEAAQKELEGIVERLERGQPSLDEAIALWERGEELLRLCLARLDAAHGKIEELAQRAESATPFSEPESAA